MFARLKTIGFSFFAGAILLLASCNFAATTAPPSPTSTATQKPSQTPEPSSTPTLEPPAFVVHLQPRDGLKLRFIHMFDENNGWAIGGSEAAEDHLFATANGGLQWKDISPPEPTEINIGEQKTASAFFLNPQLGWVHYLDSDSVWKTTDGGENWETRHALVKEIHHPRAVVPKPLQFIDEAQGWLLIYEESGMSHDYVTLYSSADGGETWVEILNPSDNEGLQSCCKSGMLFFDALRGLVTLGQGPYSRPFVEWTMDGGNTWLAQELFLPGDDPDDIPSAYCDGHSPNIFAPETAIIGLECRSGDASESNSHYLLATEDLGGFWRTSEFPGGELIFVTPDSGWAIGEEIYSTVDGGMTWDFVSQVDWVGQYSFINAEQGWVVTLGEDGGNLLQTKDGGSTWVALEIGIE